MDWSPPNKFRGPADYLRMISITREQVPVYLRDSEFYRSLSCDESEEFHVPIQNLKADPLIENFQDISHLLHTLQYWGCSLPEESIYFLLTLDLEERGKVFHLMSELDYQSGLLNWYKAVDELNNDQYSPKAVCILVPYIASNLEVIRDITIVTLSKVGEACGQSRAHIISYITGEFERLLNLLHDFTPLTHIRNIAYFLCKVCKDMDVELLDYF